MLASRRQEGFFGVGTTACSESGLLLGNLVTRWEAELRDVEGLSSAPCGSEKTMVCSPGAFRLLFLGCCLSSFPQNSVDLMETRLGRF